jgi:tetratricopeptide (TPR) repeat protein
MVRRGRGGQPPPRRIVRVAVSPAALRHPGGVASADELLAAGQYEAAVDAYTRAIGSAGASPELLAGRGTALHALRRQDEALRDLDAALGSNPELDEARYYRSVVRAQLGDPSAALSDLDTVIEHGFRPAYVFADRGAVHALLGDLERALGDCRTAVRLDPELGVAHVNLGTVLARTGQLAEAAEHFAVAARAGVPGAAELAALARSQA